MKTPDKADVVASIVARKDKWREDRRPHEVQWYFNAAADRGLQWGNWNTYRGVIEEKVAPTQKMRITVNHLMSKNRARKAKFLRNKFDPYVVPASNDTEDIQNASATKLALDYILQKQRFESVYRQALNWAVVASKGFIFLYWDPTKIVRIKTPEGPQEAPLGDICLEVASPFEILVADPGCPTLAKQPEFIRVRMRHIDEVKARYPKAKELAADGALQETFTYERQIASLNNRGSAGTSTDGKGGEDGEPDHIEVIEYFKAPDATYPKGRYIVVAGNEVLRSQDALPYSLWQVQESPYPVVEIADMDSAGQFWNPTLTEQAIPIQKEYNLYRSKLAEQIKLAAHPKLLVASQHQMGDDQWDSDPGEKVTYVYYPGIPPPQIMEAPNIISDIWRALTHILDEFDRIYNIYPASVGGGGSQTSGFQTNLLQEASDSVHMPDIRLHEMAIEDLCYKIRHIMVEGYDVPRLLSIMGDAMLPDVVEFSQNNIDEAAEIKVWTGTALSASPAIRTQQSMEMFEKGALGPQTEPQTLRTLHKMMDARGLVGIRDKTLRDENMARQEHNTFKEGAPAHWPGLWEDHDVHWDIHTDQLKSPAVQLWPPEAYSALVEHIIYHAYFKEPTQAMNVANEVGRPDLVQVIQQKMMAQQMVIGQAQMMLQQGQPQQQPQAPQQPGAAEAGPTPPPGSPPQG